MKTAAVVAVAAVAAKAQVSTLTIGGGIAVGDKVSLTVTGTRLETTSLPIALAAGTSYYVRALMKEGGGGDNLAVAWIKSGEAAPANDALPIPGSVLTPANSINYTYAGFVNNEGTSALISLPSGSIDASTTTSAGDVDITIAGADAANYDVTHVNGKLTIAPAALTISAVNKEVLETVAIPEFTYTVSGFLNGEDSSVVTTAPSLTTDADNTVPGDYAIVPSGAVATNYAVNYVNGNLKVNTLAKPKVTSLVVSNKAPSVGAKVTMTATATGDLITYKWFSGRDLIEGETSNTLVVEDIGLDQSGLYFVEVRNLRGKAKRSAKIIVSERANEVFLVVGENSSTVSAEGLIAKWDFNDTSDTAGSSDSVAAIQGVFAGGAKYGDGRLGAGSALDVSGTAGVMLVEDGGFLNAASALDTITFVFWQKVENRTNSTSFNAFSASSGSGRAAHGHVPWGGGDIYWDTAGCCDGGTQRINKGWGGDYSQWNQFVFVKNGDTKEIWVNGSKLHSGTNTSDLPTDITRLSVGGNIDSATSQGNSSVDGLIDDFRVFSSALSGEQILQMYLAESGLYSADLALKALLEGEGFTVTLQGPAHAVSDVDPSHMSFVVISSTLNDDSWAAKYAGTTSPVINLDGSAQDALGFIDSRDDLSGSVSSATQVEIVDAGHPLAGGLSAGAQTVVSSAATLSWGAPNASATLIATAGGVSHQGALYGYEAGSSMGGGIDAAGRRVNLPFQTPDLGSLTAEGGVLLVAAVDWVSGFSIIEVGGDLSATAGDSVVLQGRSIGDNITFQWYKNGSAIAGATSSSLDLGAVQVGEFGNLQGGCH